VRNRECKERKRETKGESGVCVCVCVCVCVLHNMVKEKGVGRECRKGTVVMNKKVRDGSEGQNVVFTRYSLSEEEEKDVVSVTGLINSCD